MCMQYITCIVACWTVTQLTVMTKICDEKFTLHLTHSSSCLIWILAESVETVFAQWSDCSGAFWLDAKAGKETQILTFSLLVYKDGQHDVQMGTLRC